MMEYSEFKRGIATSQNGKYTKVLFNIQQYITDDEVRAFYPKNFFNASTEPEFFVFTDNNIIRFTQNDTVSEVSYFKDFRVEKLSIVRTNNRKEELQLEIKLSSGDKFIFNSKEDSNHDWAYDYTDYIENIFKLLK
ncbi:DUF3908 family protein [Paenibacillus amylolyticus]|uniref:DUF3908 family protein n=1 Tax=Paenibacillus amylolyticus TaxID=1451 RepID=UPI003398B23D